MGGGELIKSEARLDSVVFQLTPTRTRCVLVINANGKTEKIASGLLTPFLAHLKTAQDQIAKGGYSITLQPGPGAETAWFTKGTVERFVRFVSTPEVLERVNTIESEILQIEEAIIIQGNESLGLESAEAHQSRPMEEFGGSRHVDTDSEKAIILYKPGALSTESDGSTVKMENSKVQLLRVLETRKMVLQKEQGMAFARAVAAGFDVDQLEHLMAFAECFGASRLLTACTKFKELWKAKHETGQWVDIEAAEAMSMRSEFSAVNASGIMFSGANGDLTLNNNGKASSDTGAEISSQHLSPETIRDKRLPGDAQYPIPPHEYFQGQFQHPMFPQWPIQSPQGAPVFQPYPMQGMPYYQNYPGGGPYFQPPYAPTEDPRYTSQRRRKPKKQSTDDKDSNEESETSETEDGVDPNASGLGKDVLESLGIHKKGRSGKKKGGTVVIRNINYITSKRHSTSGSESESASSLENEEKGEDLHSAETERKHKKSSRPSKDKGVHRKSVENANTYDEPACVQEGDSGNWQVFQSFLLRNEDNNGVVPADEGMFSGEKQPPLRRRQSNTREDPVVPAERNLGDISGQRFIEFDTVNGRSIRRNCQGAPDVLINSNEGRGLMGEGSDVRLQDMESGAGGYRSRTSDDFMLHDQEHHSQFKGYLDPLAENAYRSSNLDKSPQTNVSDESFILPFRSGTPEQAGTDNRATIDIDSEFPSCQRDDNLSKIRNHVSYEPDDLTMMPERDLDMESLGYDLAIEYDMEAHVNHNILTGNTSADTTSLSIKEEPKKPDREKKSKNLQDNLERRKMDALKKGKISKMNPQAEARARAEKLRAFKADMQKLKQEKEEEQRQRLEALKREREKRIAARGGSSAVSTPLQNHTRLPSKVSLVSHMGSKFSDSEPSSSSPLQRKPIKTSAQSTDSQKAMRTSRLNGTHSDGNGLSKSVSSLTEMKKEHTPESKSITVVRRLSEPRTSSLHRPSSLKSAGSVQISKQTSDLKSNKTHHISSMKSESRDQIIKKVSNEIQVKKNSAILNLDKSKSATLPELKIRSPTAPVTSQSKITKEAQLENGSKSPPKIVGDKLKKTTEYSDGDDSLVIEKTVVILEEEKYSSVTTTEGKSGIINISSICNEGEKTEAVAAYSAIWAPPSPVIGSDFAKDAHKSLLEKQPGYKVEKDPEKLCTSIHIGKAYEAPHARASSLEDSSVSNLVCAEAPVVTGSQLNESSAKIVTHISNLQSSSSMEHSPETLEKPRGKESSKGFKRLLKFGRKSQASSSEECNTEADSSSIGDTIVSSTEASTLKNLISEDDFHAGGTPKGSRSFSILSPFRSKVH